MKTIQERLIGLLGLVFSPTIIFKAINESPHWVLPLVLAALIRTLRVYIVYSPNRTPVAALLTFLMEGVLPLAIQILACTGAFMGFIYALGGSTSFKKVFSVLSHTFFVYTLITVLLSCLIILLAPDRDQLDLQNPLITNLGFFVSPEKSLALNYLLSSVDLIAFYHIFLIALGLSAVAARISFRKALLMVSLCYALYVAVGVGIKAVVA